MTLNDLVEIYLENHRSIRKVTEINYRKAINAHIKDSFVGSSRHVAMHKKHIEKD